MLVIDASVAADLVLPSPDAPRLAAVLAAADAPWHAPHLIDAEVAYVLRRYAPLGAIGDSRGERALQLLSALPIERHDAAALLGRVWALRHAMTAHDALYVALAEVLAATFVTRDRRLASVAQRVVSVEVL